MTGLPASTLITTQYGQISINKLTKEDRILVQDSKKNKLLVPIESFSKVRITSYFLLSITLSDGRKLRICLDHPFNEKKRFCELKEGDILDRAVIEEFAVVEDKSKFRYDILPRGNHAYFANNVKIESSLNTAFFKKSKSEKIIGKVFQKARVV